MTREELKDLEYQETVGNTNDDVSVATLDDLEDYNNGNS